MDTTKAKSVVVDLITGVVLLGVVALGYFTFKKDSVEESTTTTVAQNEVVQGTLEISRSINQTSQDLSTLNDSVIKSAAVFDSEEFSQLRDFSQRVSDEPVGREYPFVKTDWKIKFEAIEASTQKASSQQSSLSSVEPGPAPVAPSESDEEFIVEGI